MSIGPIQPSPETAAVIDRLLKKRALKDTLNNEPKTNMEKYIAIKSYTKGTSLFRIATQFNISIGELCKYRRKYINGEYEDVTHKKAFFKETEIVPTRPKIKPIVPVHPAPLLSFVPQIYMSVPTSPPSPLPDFAEIDFGISSDLLDEINFDEGPRLLDELDFGEFDLDTFLQNLSPSTSTPSESP